MKKYIISLIALSMMSMPTVTIFARDGAGIAAGLVGGALIAGAVSSSGRRRARAAEEEARQARRDVDDVRREQQQEKVYGIERKMDRQYMSQRAGRTINMLILAIVLLFLGIIGLAVMIFRRK